MKGENKKMDWGKSFVKMVSEIIRVIGEVIEEKR